MLSRKCEVTIHQQDNLQQLTLTGHSPRLVLKDTSLPQPKPRQMATTPLWSINYSHECLRSWSRDTSMNFQHQLRFATKVNLLLRKAFMTRLCPTPAPSASSSSSHQPTSPTSCSHADTPSARHASKRSLSRKKCAPSADASTTQWRPI